VIKENKHKQDMSNQKKSEIKKKSIIVESLGFSTEEP